MPLTDPGGNGFDLEAHASVVAGGCELRRLIGHQRVARAPPVDLQAAAEGDLLERTASGRGAERMHRACLGRLDRLSRVEPRMRLVDPEVGDRGRRELGNHLDHSLAVSRVDSHELASPESAAGRIEVEACDLDHLGARLEELGDASAELAAHTGDQDALHRVLTPPPLPAPGSFRAVASGTG